MSNNIWSDHLLDIPLDGLYELLCNTTVNMSLLQLYTVHINMFSQGDILYRREDEVSKTSYCSFCFGTCFKYHELILTLLSFPVGTQCRNPAYVFH